LIAFANLEPEARFKYEDYAHSTQRELNYHVVTPRTHTDVLVKAAHAAEQPRLSPEPLLVAFPFSSGKNITYGRPAHAWSDLRRHRIIGRQPTPLRQVAHQIRRHVILRPPDPT
jgi:hypothetical protein